MVKFLAENVFDRKIFWLKCSPTEKIVSSNVFRPKSFSAKNFFDRKFSAAAVAATTAAAATTVAVGAAATAAVTNATAAATATAADDWQKWTT